MRQWLQEETHRVMKEAELRVTDAAAFVTDYLTGEISKKELGERFSAYTTRWGDEALSDVPSLRDGMTAEEIYKAQREHRERTDDDRPWTEKSGTKSAEKKGHSH